MVHVDTYINNVMEQSKLGGKEQVGDCKKKKKKKWLGKRRHLKKRKVGSEIKARDLYGLTNFPEDLNQVRN